MGRRVLCHIFGPNAAGLRRDDPACRLQFDRRAQLLVTISVTCNAIEAIIAISAGLVAGSHAWIHVLGLAVPVMGMAGTLITQVATRHDQPARAQAGQLRCSTTR